MTASTEGLVLYFEDELEIATMVSGFLTQQGYQVTHFPQFPDGGLAQLRDRYPHKPDVVLVDVNMPGLDGYQICQLLRDNYPQDITVVFTSGLMSDEDIFKAYASGADDYLIKPLRLQELVVKLTQARKAREQQIAADEQAQTAMKLAFDAMKNSSELGEILRFQERIQQVQSQTELAELTFESLNYFELEGTMVFFDEAEPQYFRSDKSQSRLELESVIAARQKGRIYSWKQYSFFSYEYFTVLIRNMPIHDEERYGVLKDQLCLLLNGLDGRIQGLHIEQSEQEKQRRIRTISQVLAGVVVEMEQNSTAFTAQFEKIILDMETDLLAELSQFNLLENEEKVLIGKVEEALTAATALFERSLDQEQEHKLLINKLLDKLNNS